MSSNDGVESSVGVVEDDELEEDEVVETPQGPIFQLLNDEQIATLIWNSLEYAEQLRLKHVCKGFGQSIKQHGLKYAAIKLNDTRLITYNHYTWSGREGTQRNTDANQITYDVFPIEDTAPELTVALLDLLDVVQDVVEISMTFLERADEADDWNDIVIELIETLMNKTSRSLRILRLYWVFREQPEPSPTPSNPESNNNFQSLYQEMAERWPNIESLVIRSTFESIAQFGPLLVGQRLKHIDIQAYCLIDPDVDDEEADNWFGEMSPYIADLSVKVLKPVGKEHVRGCWHDLIHNKLDRLVKLSIPDFEATPYDLSSLIKRHKRLKSIDICIEIPPIGRSDFISIREELLELEKYNSTIEDLRLELRAVNLDPKYWLQLILRPVLKSWGANLKTLKLVMDGSWVGKVIHCIAFFCKNLNSLSLQKGDLYEDEQITAREWDQICHLKQLTHLTLDNFGLQITALNWVHIIGLCDRLRRLYTFNTVVTIAGVEKWIKNCVKAMKERPAQANEDESYYWAASPNDPLIRIFVIDPCDRTIDERTIEEVISRHASKMRDRISYSFEQIDDKSLSLQLAFTMHPQIPRTFNQDMATLFKGIIRIAENVAPIVV